MLFIIGLVISGISSQCYDNDPNCTCGMTFDEEQLFEIIKWWSEGVIQIIINTLGILGNFISLLVLLSKDQQNLFNMSLTMLTFFDTIFNITDILESIRRIHYNPSRCVERSWFQVIHLYLWPQFLYPLRDIAMASSMYMTIALATERYLAVSKPITSYIAKDKRTWKNMIWYTLAMVIGITACMSPLFFEFKIETLYFECARNGDTVKEINRKMYLENLTVKCRIKFLEQKITQNALEHVVSLTIEYQMISSSSRSSSSSSRYLCLL